MKQLLLDTSHITPTGDKNRPVVVRPTLMGRTINLVFAAFMLFEGIMHLCDTHLDHNMHYYIRLLLSVFGVVLFVRNALLGERPENRIDTESYTNLQQYALHIWKERLQNGAVCLSYLSFCLSVYCDWMGFIGFVFLAAFFLVKWYFCQQIKQAARLAPNLRLAPRVELTLGLTTLTHKLELLALVSMVISVGVALWVGVESFTGGRSSGLWIWSICLVFCTVGLTFSLRRMMRQPISVADEAEADEVKRDRWMVPLVAVGFNVFGALALGMSCLFL